MAGWGTSALQLALEQLHVLRNRKIGDLELLDLADGMHDRGVVTIAEALADLRQAQGGELLGEIHRDLARPGDRAGATRRAHLGELDVVVRRHSLLDLIDRDLAVGLAQQVVQDVLRHLDGDLAADQLPWATTRFSAPSSSRMLVL